MSLSNHRAWLGKAPSEARWKAGPSLMGGSAGSALPLPMPPRRAWASLAWAPTPLHSTGHLECTCPRVLSAVCTCPPREGVPCPVAGAPPDTLLAALSWEWDASQGFLQCGPQGGSSQGGDTIGLLPGEPGSQVSAVGQ